MIDSALCIILLKIAVIFALLSLHNWFRQHLKLGLRGSFFKIFYNIFSELRGVLIAMNFLAMLNYNIQEFLFGVSRESHGTFHIAGVVSTINIIAFHDIFLPKKWLKNYLTFL